MRLVVSKTQTELIEAFSRLSLEDRLEYLTLEIEWRKAANQGTAEMYQVYGILEDWFKEKGLDENCISQICLAGCPYESEIEHREPQDDEVTLVTSLD